MLPKNDIQTINSQQTNYIDEISELSQKALIATIVAIDGAINKNIDNVISLYGRAALIPQNEKQALINAINGLQQSSKHIPDLAAKLELAKKKLLY